MNLKETQGDPQRWGNENEIADYTDASLSGVLTSQGADVYWAILCVCACSVTEYVAVLIRLLNANHYTYSE